MAVRSKKYSRKEERRGGAVDTASGGRVRGGRGDVIPGSVFALVGQTTHISVMHRGWHASVKKEAGNVSDLSLVLTSSHLVCARFTANANNKEHL